MDHRKRLLELLNVSSIREYAEPTNFGEIMETGEYYLGLFAKAFGEGETQMEHIRAEISRNLAEITQPEARTRFGIADEPAIRQLLSEAGAEDDWDRYMGILREGIGQSGLDREQQSAFLTEMEALKYGLIDAFCAEAAKMKMVPLESLGEVTLAVAEMMKEDGDVDQVTGN
jgi:hypothetical protein